MRKKGIRRRTDIDTSHFVKKKLINKIIGMAHTAFHSLFLLTDDIEVIVPSLDVVRE